MLTRPAEKEFFLIQAISAFNVQPSRISTSVNRPAAICIFSIAINVVFWGFCYVFSFCEKDKSYRRSWNIKMADPEFNGSTSVVDWIERVELTCRLCGVELVIPLRLMGGVLGVYQQLSDNEKADVGLTKVALYKSFVTNPCSFTTRTLMADETVDVLFAALKKLAVLYRGLPERTFVYMFVAGLLAQVKQLLRASTSIEATPIEQLLERTIVRDKAELGEAVVIATQTAQISPTNPPLIDPRARVDCFCYGWIGHIAKDCTDKKCRHVCCFQCGGIWFTASNCPGNEPGDKISAPLCSPDKMWTKHNQSTEYMLNKCLA